MTKEKMHLSDIILKAIIPFIALLLFASGDAFAQNLEDRQNTRPDKIFSETIHTVILQREGVDLSDPVLVLNEDVKLECSFDDLDEDYKDYKYTIVHCDPWWKPTEGLVREDYLDSYYFEEYINEQDPSYNTTTPYIHYSFTFPNDNMKLKLSGNYKLIVFEDTPEQPVFTHGFMVIEQIVSMEGRIAKSANPAKRPEVQQLFFNINLNGFYVEDPYRNMEIIVSQHGRWDNELSGIKPSMIMNNKLHFEQEGMIVFKGNNEFRFWDFKSLRYLTPKVIEIGVADGMYEVLVSDRKPSRFLAYRYREDINGKYLIHTEDGTDAGIESDYLMAKLFLPYDRPIAGGYLYVTGDFCNWQYLEENRAIYSPGEGGYIVDMFLKQGYYNYTWAVVELGNLPADAAFIDGTFSDVQNLYVVRMYYRDPGEYYYRLLGRHVFNSSDNF